MKAFPDLVSFHPYPPQCISLFKYGYFLISVILMVVLGPTPRVSYSVGLGWSWEFSFLIYSQVMLVILVKATQLQPLPYILLMPFSFLTDCIVIPQYDQISGPYSIFLIVTKMPFYRWFILITFQTKPIHYVWLLCLLCFFHIFARPINLLSLCPQSVSFV